MGKDQIKFEVASSTDFPLSNNGGYDLIAFFDSFHDMGDPQGAAAHALKSLKQDGIVMLVEPFANNNLEDNLIPLGRMFYAASSMICVLSSMASNGPSIRSTAGEAKISEVMNSAGFEFFRRAAQTPVNLIYEAKL